MPQILTRYKIFVASPSDLNDERSAINEVIDELNLTFATRNNLFLEVIKWETHSAPGASQTYTQDLISSDLGTDYDIFIGMLWKKFGTQTESASSGTEEEFNNALNRFLANDNIQILFYFKTSAPKSLKDINHIDLGKIESFKSTLPEKKILYWDFDDVENLKNYLRLHIPKRITDLIDHSNSEEAHPQNTPFESEEMEELGLLDFEEKFHTLITESNNSLGSISDATEWIGVEIDKKASELGRLSKLPSPNQSVLLGILKRTAMLMEEYTLKLKSQTPIFYQNFEEALKTGSLMLNVAEDFVSEQSIENLENSKESLIFLKNSISYAITSMTGFYGSVNSLPRIQKDVNSAKRKLTSELNNLINKLDSIEKLVDEYFNELVLKIEKLKFLQKKLNS